ncbi:hypothetical protein A15D_02618 [Alcanivorax sp. MD8A]|uniref:hypothetical protein n=1 Tax=Alcanivorax sp. MD8A TaxID=1177157 RepID=UPI000C9C36E2|nr:hypothetical protein [Alcanivorax sp. MD8A]PNE01842.1 hypothetical protein A15D_02618 [Alcanivorax sp. MD8A]
MPEGVLAGILLTIGAVGAAFYTATGPANQAPWMRNPIFSLLGNVGGFICGFAGIYVLGTSIGWLSGLGAWAVTGFVSAMVVRAAMSIFPLVFLLSIVCMGVGLYLWLFGGAVG